VRHITVGESRFGYEACRRAYDLAREDAERSEWLAQRARFVAPEERDEPVPCEVCGQPLPLNARQLKCHACRRREDMRRLRSGVRIGRPKTEFQPCECCGKSIRKWTQAGNVQRFCHDCRSKSLAWRRAQAQKRAMEAA
jgi:hypothetical protein